MQLAGDLSLNNLYVHSMITKQIDKYTLFGVLGFHLKGVLGFPNIIKKKDGKEI